MNEPDKQPENQNVAPLEPDAEIWVKPEVTSFAPVKAAEGISYRPGDGLSNLS